MTAEKTVALIAEGGIEVDSDFIINNRVGEYMREDWFKEYPLKSLIYDGEYRSKYIRSKSWREEPMEGRFPFPENYVMFHERMSKYKSNLKFPEEGKCILVVTHGFVVREMCWRMN